MKIKYLTAKRYEELKKELMQLKTIGRQEIAKKIKQAKELGDLRENAEYEQAREEQRWLESRILELEYILSNATIIKKTHNNQIIKIGSEVKVKRLIDKKELNFVIVGSDEANPIEGKISNESPIGLSLLGKKIGDIVKVKTPQNKEVEYEILEIN